MGLEAASAIMSDLEQTDSTLEGSFGLTVSMSSTKPAIGGEM
jgi:hypothetical protein